MSIFNIYGNVKILIEGFFIEKFINICTYKGVKLNNIKRLNGCILETSVSISDFRKLKTICKKTKCRLKIIDKKGIAFWLFRYRKRKFIFIPIILIIILLCYLNTLIFQININCDNEEIKQNVIEALQEMNVKKFSSKNAFDKDYIINDIMIKIPQISWMEMEIKGINLNVEVKLGIIPPSVINEKEYCNIVATKTGVIDKVVVKNGLKIVKEGDIIEKGDTLISGIITSETKDEWKVRAQGEVYAKVWYNKKIEVPLVEEKYIYTGNKTKYQGINLFNKKIFFGKVSTNYEEYDTILQEKKIKIFNISLPFKIYEYIYIEKKQEKIVRTYEEAASYGTSILENMLKDVLPSDSKVLDNILNTNNLGDFVQIELIYECLEQIGEEENIL